MESIKISLLFILHLGMQPQFYQKITDRLDFMQLPWP